MNIHPTAIIHDNVFLGENVTVEAYAVLGSCAEHKDYFKLPPGKVIIGDNCVIREFVTVNAGTDSSTVVGDNCILLRGCHIGHDAKIGRNVTVSCNVMVGGHSIVMEFANLGLSSVIKQKLVVGAGVMLGMNATATRNLEPWCIYTGTPAKIQGQNVIGLTRSKLFDDEIAVLQLEYMKLCKQFT